MIDRVALGAEHCGVCLMRSEVGKTPVSFPEGDTGTSGGVGVVPTGAGQGFLYPKFRACVRGFVGLPFALCHSRRVLFHYNGGRGLLPVRGEEGGWEWGEAKKT